MLFGKEEEEDEFRGSRSSRLLGLVFCLMMIDVDDDGFWKKRGKSKDQP